MTRHRGGQAIDDEARDAVCSGASRRQVSVRVSEQKQQSVHFVSLGCPKNRVDSEVMLGHLSAAGYHHQSEPEDADVVVVNTCSFIGPAKEESVDAILEMARLKEAGRVGKLVVAGCLSQRYAPELAKEIPEVDHFLGTGNFETIGEVLGGQPQPRPARSRLPIVDAGSGGQPPRRQDPTDLRRRNRPVPYAHVPDPDAPDGVWVPAPAFTLTSEAPRVMSQAPHSTYLKVSEGCSNTCAFCIVPKLRGPQRSRPIWDVVAEAERLVQGGAVELNLIAQDLCAYGKDLSPKQSLAELLRQLDKLAPGPAGRLWIRMLYAYPRGLTREVMDVMAGAQHIVPYLDMPLQHIADGMLRRMRRGKGGKATRELLRCLRRNLPNLSLRTTFIAGLPGETEADFNELCEFVRELRFEHMGVFPYSPEEDTPAAEMPNQVPTDLAAERAERLMDIQREISAEQQQALRGQTLEVLVDGPAAETELLLQGRHAGQAPDIDGSTYITSGSAAPGDIVRVHVDQAGDYDVAGEIVSTVC